MRRRTRTALAIGALFLTVMPIGPAGIRAAAASYQRRWYVIAGGGQISNVDPTQHYRLGGTTGQPTVERSNGGLYRVRASYWTQPAGIAYLDAPPDAAGTVVTFRAPTISPNPSVGSSTVEFATAENADATLRILDVTGRRVRDLIRGSLGAGPHRVPWDGRDDSGRRVPSGIYFVTLTAGHHHGQVKLVMLSNGGSR